MVLDKIDQNLLPDMSEWVYHILDGSANINIDADEKTINANVTKTSSQEWQIQTFDASCTIDTEMSIGFTRYDNDNYPCCWANSVKLSKDLQTYTFIFTSRYDTQSDWYLYFSLGNTAGDYIIKNPKLIEVGTNLLPDVTNWTHYVSSGSAQMASDAQTQTFTANVTADGLYEWDIQAQARNLTLEKGKKYKLSVDMACSEETALSMGILHQVGSEYPACWSNSVLLTPEKKTYTFLFDMTEETNSDWYLYFNFAESTGNYVISNAVLMEPKSAEFMLT
ncbi:MAG: carbohydrate binding domain-containing protein [Ruminococcus sp.]